MRSSMDAASGVAGSKSMSPDVPAKLPRTVVSIMCFTAAVTLECAVSICHCMDVSSRTSKRLPGGAPGAILLVVQEPVAQTTYSKAPAGRAAGPGEHWRRASEPELGAWRAFLRAGAASTLALEAALAETGVSNSEYDVLVNLANAPRDGLRPTDL